MRVFLYLNYLFLYISIYTMRDLFTHLVVPPATHSGLSDNFYFHLYLSLSAFCLYFLFHPKGVRRSRAPSAVWLCSRRLPTGEFSLCLCHYSELFLFFFQFSDTLRHYILLLCYSVNNVWFCFVSEGKKTTIFCFDSKSILCSSQALSS